MKIRIIKKLPRCEIGQEFEIENLYPFKYIRVGSNYVKKCVLVYYLDEIEGYYEKVVEMPSEGEEFWWMDCYGRCNESIYEVDSTDSSIINFQGWYKTKESAEAFRDKILKIKEREDD